MQVFTSSAHALHAPKWYLADGTTRPCPDNPARVAKILTALQSAGHPITPLETPSTLSLPSALAHIHSPDYLHYLQTIHSLWSAEFGLEIDVLPDTFPRPRTPHLTRPASPIAQAGYYCFDMAAPITAGTWPAVLAGTRLAIAAADALLHNHRVAYALCRPPGHHAGADYCGGFCYLNNAAVAAQHLLISGKKRVAILDIDYHHGNGTQDIFYARNDVLFLSLHADPNTQYPYFWGHASETGIGEGLGFNHNFPLPRGTDESTWLTTLTRALHILTDYDPEALILSLGVDTYEHDTVGDFKLSLEGYGQAATQISGLNLPTAIIQEGGYNLDAVGPCVSAFLSAFRA